MELRHLRYFAAVAEEENVSRAAGRLHVSQPGLSRQIHDLEEELGFPLFARSAKSVRLTDAGKVFLGEARAVLQRVDEAVAAARAAAKGAEDEIKVGYAPSLTVQILPATLRIFQAKFPRVRVALHDLSTEEILTAVRARQLHAGLLVRPPRRMLQELQFKELARYPIRVVVAPRHPLAKARVLSLAQIAAEPLLAYSRKEYPEYHELLEEVFGNTRLKPKIAEEHDGVTSIIAAVESGRGIALAPSCIACMVGPRLKLIPVRETLPEIVIGAAWRKGPAPLLLEEFLAAAATAGD
ncbi:MAG TPA: LysR substrate-binding domain-containing protein [Verrucomicrobiae bacterium]|jgi:DNA-binding transcriptional LysR family regulator|nr:LysR substrate-binding domain-containing protein [Verrucomicrobiae bacterium]